jgi:hypothetical protein
VKIYMRVSAFIRICPRRDIGVLCCPSYMAWWSKHPISGDGLIPWQMWRTEYQARRAIVEYSGKEMLFEDMGRIRHHGSRLELREQFQAPDDFLPCSALPTRPETYPEYVPCFCPFYPNCMPSNDCTFASWLEMLSGSCGQRVVPRNVWLSCHQCDDV